VLAVQRLIYMYVKNVKKVIQETIAKPLIALTLDIARLDVIYQINVANAKWVMLEQDAGL
jgi:hypothetical protein